MTKEAIGGYFALEIQNGREYHTNAIRLNTGRHALEYVLAAKGYKKIYLPYYTCDVIFEPVHRQNVEIEFYSIDKKFKPIFDFTEVGKEEVFLYTNYFGICSKQVQEVISQGCNLIIDNAQSFFSKPVPGIDTFYSARKFFGVPDGAYLYTGLDLAKDIEYEDSSNRCEHLIQRIEKGPEEGYSAFKANDKSFKDSPIRKMSKISKRLLAGIDYHFVKARRQENFTFLHDQLNFNNKLEIDQETSQIPLAYPYLTETDGLRDLLIEHKIYVPKYWPNVSEFVSRNSLEYNYTQNILPLPIDHRYTIKDMQYILKIIRNGFNVC